MSEWHVKKNLLRLVEDAFRNRLPVTFRNRKYYVLNLMTCPKGIAQKHVDRIHKMGFRAIKVKLSTEPKYKIFVGRRKN